MHLGVVIPLSEISGLKRIPRYSDIRDIALQVETAGFDSVWLYDHLLYRAEGEETRGIWECWTILSALAEATTRVTLGSMVLCNGFRNPALVAKMATTLDEVSSGRFVLGLGAGWNRAEFDAFGIPFDNRVSRIEEALQIIKPLLKDGTVDFHGDYYQVTNCEIIPRGPRSDGPPLLIGGFGPRMIRLVARFADMWNTGYTDQASALAEPLANMKGACSEIGRDLSTLAVTAEVSVAYPELGEVPSFMEDYLTGSATEIAAAISGFRQIGLKHLMFRIEPFTDESFNRLTSALAVYRTRTDT